MKNYIIISILFFISGIFLIIVSNTVLVSNAYLIDNNNKENSTNQGNEISSIQVEESNDAKIVNINLSFIGDSLVASLKGIKNNMNFQDLLDTHDLSFPFKNVSHIFEKDDFTIANSENVFTDKNLLEREKDHNPAYWYFSKTKYANIYKENSIEIVSVMNNHTYDYGQVGFDDTVLALQNAGTLVLKEDTLILSKNDIKIGIIACNLFHEYQANSVISQIKKIKDKVNYVIIYFHGGVEYQLKPTEEIKKYARSFIDSGANLVIGHHPHILQPIEIYKNKTIVYSLGSFLFSDANFLNRTIIYQMNLEFDLENNSLKENSNIIPCYLYSQKEGYEKLIPDLIKDKDEKQKVIDFMHGLRESPK